MGGCQILPQNLEEKKNRRVLAVHFKYENRRKWRNTAKMEENPSERKMHSPLWKGNMRWNVWRCLWGQ